jgi:hypothetical protein
MQRFGCFVAAKETEDETTGNDDQNTTDQY